MQKKKLTKEEMIASKEKLQARKDRMKTLGYKWSPCKYCGQTIKHRGEKPTEICGQEDCQKKLMDDELKRRKEQQI